MFNFGLFTTHLPYLVFIAAYLFYLLLGAGNETMDGGARESSDKIILCKSTQSDVTFQSQKVAFYDGLYARLNETATLRSPVFQNAVIIRVTSDERIKGERYSYQAFSRPPPFVG